MLIWAKINSKFGGECGKKWLTCEEIGCRMEASDGNIFRRTARCKQSFLVISGRDVFVFQYRKREKDIRGMTMAISEYRKIQIEQRELDRRLDEIAMRKAQQRSSGRKASYCMHTPKEAMQRLGKKSQSRY